MTRTPPEQHILLIEDGKRQHSICLDAATYSIGRDQKNAIVLPFEDISREHALLLRVPVPRSEQYRYRIVDGSPQGKPSSNGIAINGERCHTHNLQKGDVITFGECVKASYLILHMDRAELKDFLGSNTVNFQSIKQSTTDPIATIVDLNFDPAAHGIPKARSKRSDMKSFRLYRTSSPPQAAVQSQKTRGANGVFGWVRRFVTQLWSGR